MKRINFVLLTLLFISFYGCSFIGITKNPGGEKIIVPSLAKQYIDFLASDSLNGRNTPSPGLDTAAQFIIRNFKKASIQPVNGSYLQKVKMGYISLGKENFLKIKKGSEEISYKIKDEFTPFEFTANKEVNAPVVFVGYGINAPEYKYNDFENIDVKGKVVFILKHEPGENDTSSVFNGKALTKYSNIKEKINAAVKQGAVGVLICQDPLNHNLLTPRGFPWPSLSKFIPNDALPLSLQSDEKDKVPVVQVGEEVINYLFVSVDKLKEIQAVIDKSLKPNSFNINDVTVSIKTSTTYRDESSNNVVGLIEGTDPKLKDEIVIVGAHYDHLGYMKNHTEGEDYIYNGADDNASGTAAMMEIANAFAASSEKPERSVLFIAFCGEEKGLFGSRYYVESPLFPLSKTVAMINLDMVGRNSIDSISIFGASKFPHIAEIVKEANRNIGFSILFDPELKGGSDNMSFAAEKIPSIFFHSGLHPQYHTLHDEVGLINYNKIAKTAKLAFRTAWAIANENKYYNIKTD